MVIEQGANSQVARRETRRSPRQVAVAVFRVVLIVLVVAAAGYALGRNWEDVRVALDHLSAGPAVVAGLLVIAGIICGTMSWQVFVDDFGAPIGATRGGQIFLVGQLGKYLPGSVWAYVLQMELGRRAGLARARVFAATIFSLVVAVVAALVVGAVALPQLLSADASLGWLKWLYVLLPIGLVSLYPPVLTRAVALVFRVVRRQRPDHPVRLRTVLVSLAWAIGSYLCSGTQLWVLVREGVGIRPSQLALYVGTMGIAMVAGVFAILLPSGAGVRELVIITALAPSLGTGRAVAYAALSRVLFTVADLVTAGAAALVAGLARRRGGTVWQDGSTLARTGDGESADHTIRAAAVGRAD